MQKYIIIILAILCNYGCGEDAYQKKDNPYDTFVPLQIPLDTTTLLPYTSTTPEFRYFLFSYKYALQSHDEEGEGYITYQSKTFPTKSEIDDGIFDGLPYKRGCYQSIIITSIFEFNNKSDFDSFSKGVSKRKVIANKNKLSCE